MKKNYNYEYKSRYLPLLALFSVLVFWIVDASVDHFVFYKNQTFIESFFSTEPMEIWMRSLVMIIMITFALYTRSLLAKQHKITLELQKYKDDLERRGKKLQISNDILSKEIIDRKKIQKDLEVLATTDSLTELYNRRKFNEVLKYEIDKAKRYPTDLSIIFCDIDKFKSINDTFGHDIGDEVLKSFALILKSSLRKSDVVARWGGEEFTILLTNETPQDTIDIVEKIRKEIESYKFEKVDALTASFGISYLKENDTDDDILIRADKALYDAKKKGRNCTEVII